MTRLWIIEDDADFADVLRESLELDASFEVAKVIPNKREAEELIAAGALADVDCALVDLQLPTSAGSPIIDPTAGLDIVELMRRQHFYGTIIILTNSHLFADGSRALEAGCDGYLCKHAELDAIPQMLDELKLALRGNVMLVSREMRHVFIREDVTAKEARLMDMLAAGRTWSQIASELGYKTSKAAANTGDHIFDKLLTGQDRLRMEATGAKKRQLAVQLWKSRHSSSPTTAKS